jgi:hypothetical protein
MDNGAITIVVALWFGSLVAAVAITETGTYQRQESETHKTLIKKNLGMYCPKSGEFAFIGDCK